VKKQRKRNDLSAVVDRLEETRARARLALAGNSNDNEHDALYEVQDALSTIMPEVRRIAEAG